MIAAGVWPFDETFMQLALAAGVVVGACAPLIGAFLVQKRMSLLGDGIGHIAFAGVAGGILLDIWPVWSALAIAILGALALERLRRTGIVGGDLALALFFYGGIALGVVLLSLSSAFNANVLQYLFGAILTVTPAEVGTIAGLGGAIVAVIAVAGRALFASVIDEEAARVAGLPVDGLNSMLAVLTAVTVVIAMRAVGILLVAALMVVPVGASQALARSFRTTVLGASLVGVASVVAGLTASRAWDVAPGGAIVLAAGVAFGVATLATGRRAGRMPVPHGPGIAAETHETHTH
jgi:zinc transport system permease protein